jgi:DNA-binding Xre family transcriptional regulator
MINLRIKALLTSKGIAEPFAWLVKKGISRYSAHRLLKGNYDRIRLKHINIICRSAYCTPNDLLEWTPDEKRGPVKDDHPLTRITPRGPVRLQEKINRMTEAEIRKWMKRMEEEDL